MFRKVNTNIKITDAYLFVCLRIINIRMDLRETGWEGLDWMYLAQDRDQWRAVMKTVMNLRVT
jgi:hypothetical protein